MIVYMFAVYALHHFYLAALFGDAARWLATTFAGWGMEHVAYYAGFGWANSDILYWTLYMIEALVPLLVFRGLRRFLKDSDELATS